MYKITTYLHEDKELVSQNRNDTLTCWTEHHIWTRNAIISTIAGLEDQEAVMERLLNNKSDIGRLLLLYYAPTDVDTIISALQEHVVIIAAIAKVPEITPELEVRMAANDALIANFLEYLNSYFWTKTKVVPLWDAYTSSTLQEIKARKGALWVEDIAAADASYINAKAIAQLVHSGLFYQNLEKFSKPAIAI
jgi:hypothetical protein